MVKVRGYVCIVAGLLLFASRGWAQYTLHIQPVDKDSLFIYKQLGLPASFKTREACAEYVYALPAFLQGKGYMTASVDSVGDDTAGTTIRLFVGEVYRWTKIDIRRVDPALLAAVAWNEKTFSHRVVDFR